jgi:uncharacterized membrane protein YGL010W
MQPTDPLPAQPRDIKRWLGDYARDHQHPLNQAIHWVCVPLILWALIALLWTLPVPAALGRQGAWAGFALALLAVWYWRQSRPLGALMLLALVALGLICHALFGLLGATALALLAASVFVLAWIGQFIGHRIEGRRPSFLTDLRYLLVGPAWLMAKLMRRLRIPV